MKKYFGILVITITMLCMSACNLQAEELKNSMDAVKAAYGEDTGFCCTIEMKLKNENDPATIFTVDNFGENIIVKFSEPDSLVKYSVEQKNDEIIHYYDGVPYLTDNKEDFSSQNRAVSFAYKIKKIIDEGQGKFEDNLLILSLSEAGCEWEAAFDKNTNYLMYFNEQTSDSYIKYTIEEFKFKE